MFVDRQLTVDGFERTFALNHLAYFLLTNELLDLVTQTATRSTTRRASLTWHRMRTSAPGRIDFDNVMLEHGCAPVSLLPIEAGQHPVHQGASAAADRSWRT